MDLGVDCGINNLEYFTRPGQLSLLISSTSLTESFLRLKVFCDIPIVGA
jgi:hypothetical protein